MTNDKSTDPFDILAREGLISEESNPESGDSTVGGDDQSGSIMELLKESLAVQRELLDLWKNMTNDKSADPSDIVVREGHLSDESNPESGDSAVGGDDHYGPIMELLKEGLGAQRELYGLWKKTQVEIESLRREIRDQNSGSSERSDRTDVSSIAEELADETISQLRAVGLRG
ncbi:MAG: hypothetical protein IID12_08395 [Candidatus Marinimicrobia bacterium]|nr:hypothetical protein [Candidatus Neomarinimicrobiota bacterium]